MYLNTKLFLFLANCCQEAYNLYEEDSSFSIPQGYHLVNTFKAKSGLTTEWFGYIIKSSKNIIVAFRGTSSIFDWLEDFNISQVKYPYFPAGGMTHEGFTSIYASCREEIFKNLKKLKPYQNLFITGHSLGGALAVLCTLDIVTNTKFKNPFMLSFGSPRVGNLGFVSIYNRIVRNSIRIVNIHDPVPYLPPVIRNPFKFKKILVYKHVKNRLPISIETGNLFKNHNLETYIKGITFMQNKLKII